MINHNILIAGFGGQGIQFAGKLLTYIGMYTGLEVSLIPSYGPEMRGGTSNCGVNISDSPIASPLVVNPTELIVMNLPSFDKYEKDVVPGGKLFLDSTLISRVGTRGDIAYFAVPATRLADENGIGKLANVVMCGKFLKETGLCSIGEAEPIIKKLVPASKPQLFELNIKALTIGYAL
jgi:2-oxoglutarate ferredoxin oxidoreductase subunit gamma